MLPQLALVPNRSVSVGENSLLLQEPHPRQSPLHERKGEEQRNEHGLAVPVSLLGESDELGGMGVGTFLETGGAVQCLARTPPRDEHQGECQIGERTPLAVVKDSSGVIQKLVSVHRDALAVLLNDTSRSESFAELHVRTWDPKTVHIVVPLRRDYNSGVPLSPSPDSILVLGSGPAQSPDHTRLHVHATRGGVPLLHLSQYHLRRTSLLQTGRALSQKVHGTDFFLFFFVFKMREKIEFVYRGTDLLKSVELKSSETFKWDVTIECKFYECTPNEREKVQYLEREENCIPELIQEDTKINITANIAAQFFCVIAWNYREKHHRCTFPTNKTDTPKTAVTKALHYRGDQTKIDFLSTHITFSTTINTDLKPFLNAYLTGKHFVVSTQLHTDYFWNDSKDYNETPTPVLFFSTFANELKDIDLEECQYDRSLVINTLADKLLTFFDEVMYIGLESNHVEDIQKLKPWENSFNEAHRLESENPTKVFLYSAQHKTCIILASILKILYPNDEMFWSTQYGEETITDNDDSKPEARMSASISLLDWNRYESAISFLLGSKSNIYENFCLETIVNQDFWTDELEKIVSKYYDSLPERFLCAFEFNDDQLQKYVRLSLPWGKVPKKSNLSTKEQIDHIKQGYSRGTSKERTQFAKQQNLQCRILSTSPAIESPYRSHIFAPSDNNNILSMLEEELQQALSKSKFVPQ